MDLFDVVVLVEPVPDEGLAAGAVGTVVHVFEQPREAYEVEFADDDGRAVATVALRPEQVARRP